MSLHLFTSEVQVAGRVNDDPHQRQVEGSHLGSDLRFDTALVKVVGAQETVDCIDSLSLHFAPVKTHAVQEKCTLLVRKLVVTDQNIRTAKCFGKYAHQNKQAPCLSSEQMNFKPCGIYSVFFSCNLQFKIPFLQATLLSECVCRCVCVFVVH